MRSTVCLAPAKINLALHVTGRRPDGYHEIDTLVAFCDVADRIEVSAASGSSDILNVSGTFAAQTPTHSGNLVLRAAATLRRTCNDDGSSQREPVHCSPATIDLTKNLPVAAGVGGGSADAAATLLALEAAWQIHGHHDLDEIGLPLGADIPMCMQSRALRARGIGEVTEPISLDGDWPVLLVNPGVPIATADVFGALARRDNPPIGKLGDKAKLTIDGLSGLRNDLETPAKMLQPVIAEALTLLSSLPGCRLARMSGSGATCFTLFESAKLASAAEKIIANTKPEWWRHCGHLLAAPIANRLTIRNEA